MSFTLEMSLSLRWVGAIPSSKLHLSLPSAHYAARRICPAFTYALCHQRVLLDKIKVITHHTTTSPILFGSVINEINLTKTFHTASSITDESCGLISIF